MIFLDFNKHHYRFDEPYKVLTTKNDIEQVKAILHEVELLTNLGFYAVGFVSYEAAPAFDPLYRIVSSDFPLIWFAIFDEKNCQILNHQDCYQTKPYSLGQWKARTSVQEYKNAIKTVKDEIKLGNTYQTNYTIRLDNHFSGDPYSFYLRLKEAQQSQYSAYLDTGDHIILSASPELFFHWKDNSITTKPMKGTTKRGKTVIDDEKQKSQLLSVKNQAENVMIVDLLRNDLHRMAEVGSVHVTQLFTKEKYPTVWQLTSTIEAKTKSHTSLVDIFEALFPCGSITGAPKCSTMNIIARLETQPRKVYCGAIGIITPKKEAIFNVPIRTVIIDKTTGNAEYGVGGGITWDSTSEDEYEEIIHKSQILNQIKYPRYLLESLLLFKNEYSRLDLHLNRLVDSANYFDFQCDIKSVKQKLEDYAITLSADRYKLRLLLNKEGEITIESQLISQPTSTLIASWSPVVMQSDNVLLYHKTTERSFFPEANLEHEYLLFNERGEITEFVNGNVALLIEGQWLTPPISSGLLAGTMRECLLQQSKLKEQVLLKTDLEKAEKIAFINSVRGWRDVVWNNVD